MKISDFDYDLPNEKIAKYPPKVRGESKLLVLNKATGEIEDRNYADIFDYIEKGDVLILNDTKVIKARLIGKDNDKEIEIFILEKHRDDEHKVLIRGKARTEETYTIGKYEIKIVELMDDGTAIVDTEMDLYEIAKEYGETPIPPDRKSVA